MQRYTVYLSLVTALRVSGGSPNHHQESKTVPTVVSYQVLITTHFNSLGLIHT